MKPRKMQLAAPVEFPGGDAPKILSRDPNYEGSERADGTPNPQKPVPIVISLDGTGVDRLIRLVHAGLVALDKP